eukprot:3709824-Rhodomonas_salina.2
MAKRSARFEPYRSPLPLRACYAMPGTERATEPAYGAMRCAVLRQRMEQSAERTREAKQSRRCAIGLRICYAMSGTELAYGPIGLQMCYAVSGTVR